MPNAYLSEYKIGGYIIYGPKRKEMSIGGLPVYYVEDKLGLTALIKRNGLEGILFSNPIEVKNEQNRNFDPILRETKSPYADSPPMEDLLGWKIRRKLYAP